jgi:ADP-heptose:LPS heptosyltransferase
VADAGAQELHAVDRYLQAIRALGGETVPARCYVPIDESALAWAKETLADFPTPWLCFGVGARWRTKRWPAEHFAHLAARAQRNFGGSIIFVGRDDESPIARAVARALRGPMCDLTGKTTLPQLAAVLSLADVMVANDTGPLHLAAALGRPVVAPYTCTKVARHGPYGQFGCAVASGVWCQGSYLKRCPRLDCMRELTPDRLWPLLQDALHTWERNHHHA